MATMAAVPDVTGQYGTDLAGGRLVFGKSAATKSGLPR